MTPADRLRATLDLLDEMDRSARPVDAVTSAAFRARRDMEEVDRGAVLELVYAVLRHRARLGWWVQHLGQADTARARLLVWLVRGAGLAGDAVLRLLAAAGPGDRALLAALAGRGLEHPGMPEAVRLECPDWAEGALRQRFGDAFAAEMAAMLEPPPLDLRVNPMRGTRAAVMKALAGMGLRPRAMRLSPLGIRLEARLDLSRLPGLRTGEVEIQDEGSQLVAGLVGAGPGDRVVDFCAGAGGKTLALAAQMQSRGHLIACDVNEARLKRAAERLRRAGLHNVETRVLSGESDKWVKRHKGGFSHVLIDAPCSGTGTWRRNPDARWRAPDLGLQGLAELQGRILASAARLVRPGGRLVYATCSVLEAENEAQVARFLAGAPEFSVVPLAEAAPHLAGLEGPYLRLTPAQHGTDGFFAAVLVRQG